MAKHMRRKIYEIIEQSHDGNKLSLAYDIFMLLAIAVSIVPLMFVEETQAFRVIEQVTVTIFIIDYLLRWLTADYRLQKKGWSFVLHPFTGWAIIDHFARIKCPGAWIQDFQSHATAPDTSAFQVHTLF